MEVVVTGSLAYDRIMDFPGRFSEHIMAEKIHILNVSFTVNGLAEKFGGTAGNIAYALSLLGEKPRIVATIGQDYQRYYQWLEQRGIPTDGICVVPEELTASAYITTDQADNQITAFNPGAMKHPSRFDFGQLQPGQAIAIAAAGNLQDMASYTAACHQRGIFTIFDPGQSLPAWRGEDLARSMLQADLLIGNDYELELIKDKTGLTTERILQQVGTIITTKGEHGSEVLTRDGAVQVPAIPTHQVVDPTGAGDAFRGGLIKGLIQGLPPHRGAMMGTVCSHYAIQSYGTQEYSFTPDQFNAKLEEHFGPW